MTNNSKGAKQGVRTRKDNYGEDVMKNIGAIGGSRKGLKGMNLLKERDPEAYHRAIQKRKDTIKAKQGN